MAQRKGRDTNNKHSMGRTGIQRLIRKSTPFAYMSDQDAAAFAAAGRVVEFAPKDTIFHEDEDSTAVQLVLEGVVYICSYEPDGRQIIEAVVTPVDSFGWFSLVDPTQRTFNAVFRSHGRLLVFSKADVNQILDSSTGAWQAVARFLAERLRRVLASQRAIAGFPMERRIAFVLCQTFRVGAPGSNGIRELQLSQNDVADMTATGRQSVNRQLKDWERRGIVQVGYGRLELLDAAALHAIAFARG